MFLSVLSLKFCTIVFLALVCAQGELLWSVFVRRLYVHPSVRSSTIIKKNISWNLGVPLQKYNKGSWLIYNNKMADFLFCFKKHLLWNYHSKFKDTLQEASLGDTLQKYNKRSWLIINNNNNNNKMANFLFCFKKTSPLKLPGQIHWNFTGSFIAWLLSLHS